MASTHKALIGKWALKKWFVVHAPAALKSVEIGEVPADEPEKLINRTIEVSLFDLTRDLSHIPIKLKFQIYKVEGEHVYTRFKQVELTRDYVRSLVRRGSSKITAIHDIETKDGGKLRVTVLIVTTYRCNTSQKRAIRAIARERLNEFAKVNDFDSFILNSIFGIIPQDIFVHAKKIYPLRKVEIMKIKVLKYPEKIEEKPIVAEEKVEERIETRSPT